MGLLDLFRPKVNAKNADGLTALMRAAGMGHTETAKMLIDKGADINAKDDKISLTALSWATQRGHTEIIEMLIDKGAV